MRSRVGLGSLGLNATFRDIGKRGGIFKRSMSMPANFCSLNFITSLGTGIGTSFAVGCLKFFPIPKDGFSDGIPPGDVFRNSVRDTENANLQESEKPFRG